LFRYQNSLYQNFHEFLNASFWNDIIAEALGIIESCNHTTPFFITIVTLLLLCIIYSPKITLSRLKEGSQVLTLIELIQYKLTALSRSEYLRKCVVYALFTLLRFLGTDELPDGISNDKIFRFTFTFLYTNYLAQTIALCGKVSKCVRETEKLETLVPEMVKLTLVDRTGQDLHELFGLNAVSSENCDDDMDGEYAFDGSDKKQDEQILALQKTFLSPLKDRDEFKEFTDFLKGFRLAKPIQFERIIGLLSEDEIKILGEVERLHYIELHSGKRAIRKILKVRRRIQIK